MIAQKNFFRASAEDFKKIPGSPVAYWVSEALISVFDNKPLATVADSKPGMSTTNNLLFTRLWHEVALDHCCFVATSRRVAECSAKRWFPYNKGGEFRKWYGDNDYLVDWEDDGKRLKKYTEGASGGRMVSLEYFFKPCFTWSMITSSKVGFRYKEAGSILSNAGPSVYSEYCKYLLAYSNTKVVEKILEITSPTLNCTSGNVAGLPVKMPDNDGCLNVASGVNQLISLSRADWDSYETSWDFAANPLIAAWNSEREKAGDSSDEAAPRNQPSDGTLQGIYEKVRAGWAANCEEMRRLETENNRIFIEAYGLQDELTPEVPWHEITLTCNPWYRYGVKEVAKSDEGGALGDRALPRDPDLEERLKGDTVKELISYAVGCMMGRYAIDKPGLVLANQGATYEDYLAQISEPAFAPDDDGIIPILEDDCFADDVVTQFHRFLRVTFGERNFNANLSFIEDAIGKDLRSYFVKDFYADHLQRYQKRPIYWLFSSPKGTFSALIYLHRYHPGTVGQVLGYLRSHITKIQSRVDAADRTAADSAATQGMKTRAIKERAKLVRQLKELEDYERDVLHPLAGQRIEIDLDDGVKANYPKFGKALRKIPGLE